jgi:DNA-binding transcriptional MerR regulator
MVMPVAASFRLDDLAQAAGVPTTTVRLYQNKGLLPGPTLVGRTGWYDDAHLARLRLIGRLQHEGFSLSGIKRLLETWEQGRSLDDIVGVEQQLDAVLHGQRAVELTPEELLARFPADALSPELVQRASSLGLIELLPDGRFRVPDERFLTTGAGLLDLGVPTHVILEEWDRLVATTDEVASRFIDLFETWMLPKDWRRDLDDATAAAVAATLARLRGIADDVLAAALGGSIARLGAERLAEVVTPSEPARRQKG